MSERARERERERERATVGSTPSCVVYLCLKDPEREKERGKERGNLVVKIHYCAAHALMFNIHVDLDHNDVCSFLFNTFFVQLAQHMCRIAVEPLQRLTASLRWSVNGAGAPWIT